MFARDHPVGECAGCGRWQPVRNQYCRLCWSQARTLARQSGRPLHSAKATAVHYLDQVRDHQLFFATMLWTRGAATTAPPTRPPARSAASTVAKKDTTDAVLLGDRGASFRPAG